MPGPRGQLACAKGNGLDLAVDGNRAPAAQGYARWRGARPTAPWRVMPRSRSGVVTKRRKSQASSFCREPVPMASAQNDRERDRRRAVAEWDWSDGDFACQR